MEKRKRNKKTKDKKRLNLTKPFLIREYTDNKKSIPTIAKEINCGQMTIWRYLKRFGIKRRTLSEVKKGEKNPNFGGKFNGVRGDTRGENNPGYIDGRTKKKYYCIDCLKRGIKTEIALQTWKYGKGRCASCAGKKRSRNSEDYNFYIDGRTKAKHYCIEEGCKNEISYSNWVTGKKRCESCAHRGKRNSMFGIKGKNNPHYNRKKVKCDYCGEVIEKSPCYINEFNFCNRKCMGKWVSLNRIRENNFNWKNGISKLPYSFEFDKELKERIRKRDNYICQKCLITEEEHLIVYGKLLSIHHIDYNKDNCKEDNLITLCRECNSRVNANRTYWQGYFKEKAKCFKKSEILSGI